MTLTEEDKAHFKMLYVSGAQIRTICNHFGITQKQMSRIAYDLDLIDKLQFRWDEAKEAQLEKLIDNGLTLNGMAEKLGCSRETIKRKKAELFPSSKNYWSQPEKITQLKELVEEGLSASKIAKVMGGTTRNAVIGKVHRLGLKFKKNVGPKKIKRKTNNWAFNDNAPKYNYPKSPIKSKDNDNANRSKVFELQPGEEYVSFIDHKDSQCRCIKEQGDKVLGYCAKPAEPGSRYCAEHTARFNRGNPYRVKEIKEGQAA